MRRTALVLAALTLVVGPWPALPSGAPILSAAAAWAQVGTATSGDTTGGQVTGVAPGAQAGRGATGCSCREIVIDASNVVRNAEVRSGDVKTINRSITYIAPTFDGDDEVEVDQEAEATSGDAIAGQILGVDAGQGCARVHIDAKNIVEQSEVRSGDALAKNESVILVDPRITKRGDIEIEVDQEAEAKSGDAVAGQIIGVKGGGGPCGGVIIDALNRVRDVDVRSGEATIDNVSKILTCESVGCIDDIRKMLRFVDSVQVCSGETCESVPVDDFVELLKNPPADEPSSSDDNDADDDEDIRPTVKTKQELRDELDAVKAQYRRDHPRARGNASDTAVEAEADPSPSPTSS